MRLCDLDLSDVEKWRRARMMAGRQRYGDAHLDRYLLVDVMEELLDAKNAVYLMLDRAKRGGVKLSYRAREELMALQDALTIACDAVIWLDRHLPDELCTDGNGGYRIWWSDIAG